MNTGLSEIRKKAIRIMADGTSRQQCYEKLVAEHGNSREMADIVRYSPHPDSEKRFRRYNYALTGLITIGLVLSLVRVARGFEFVDPGVPFYAGALFVTLKRKYDQYSFFTLAGAAGLLGFIITLYFEPEWKELILELTGTVVLSLFLIYTGSFMINKIAPPYEEYREPYLNSDNEERTALKHRFSEN